MTASNTESTNRSKRRFDFFDLLYKYGTIITIVLLIIIFSIANPSFIQMGNIINILRSISIVTIIAIGITISLSVNGFDLSVGSTASLTNAVVMSMFIWYGQSTPVAILVALLAALAVGLLNSFLIVKIRIPQTLRIINMQRLYIYLREFQII